MAKRKLSFGAKLREFRTGKGMSLEAMAAQIGISSGHLSKLERGRRNPSYLVRDRINAVYEGHASFPLPMPGTTLNNSGRPSLLEKRTKTGRAVSTTVLSPETREVLLQALEQELLALSDSELVERFAEVMLKGDSRASGSV